ncbi:hypothetical protein SXCC_02893 [Gluconacetobacter sp. SXCC-1]|nr:hypothetical protein SXCC_02893 [Gluconacetobacter sp. SXCC-1]
MRGALRFSAIDPYIQRGMVAHCHIFDRSLPQAYAAFR